MARSMRLTLWGGFFVAICTTALADMLVRLAYGDAFASAGSLLAVLIWTIPLSIVSGHFRNVLIGFDRQRALLTCTGLSAAMSACVTMWLAPELGADGAVIGLLAGNAMLAASAVVAVHQSVVPVTGWIRSGFSAGVGAVVAGAVLWALRDSEPLVAGVVAGSVIAFGFVATERHELQRWWAQIAARAGMTSLH